MREAKQLQPVTPLETRSMLRFLAMPTNTVSWRADGLHTLHNAKDSHKKPTLLFTTQGNLSKQHVCCWFVSPASKQFCTSVLIWPYIAPIVVQHRTECKILNTQYLYHTVARSMSYVRLYRTKPSHLICNLSIKSYFHQPSIA